MLPFTNLVWIILTLHITFFIDSIIGGKCVDTVGWHDKINNSTCSDYVVYDRCTNNNLTDAMRFHSIPSLNFPELNCCGCGKKASINLSHTARWAQNATTVTGSADGFPPLPPNIPYFPRNIYIDDNNTLYITYPENNRVFVVPLDPISTTANTVQKIQLNAFEVANPYGIYVTRTSIYIADSLYYRVQKWSKKFSNPITVAGIDGVKGNSTSLTTLSADSSLFIDNYENIFVCDMDNHRVIMFPWNSISGTSGVIVAGTGFEGSNATELRKPMNIFVDNDRILYIADSKNHRIQKWILGASEGLTVAGTGVCGQSLSDLCLPTSILVDLNGYMYICEGYKYRIMRWIPNAHIGECIAACSGHLGRAADQLAVTFSIAFDSHGSLYASDTGNWRVQKFRMIDEPTETTTQSWTTTTSKIALTKAESTTQSWTTTTSKIALTKAEIFFTSIILIVVQIIL